MDGYFKWRIIIVVSFLSQSNLWLTSGCGGSAAHPVSTVISSYSPAEAFLPRSSFGQGQNLHRTNDLCAQIGFRPQSYGTSSSSAYLYEYK